MMQKGCVFVFAQKLACRPPGVGDAMDRRFSLGCSLNSMTWSMAFSPVAPYECGRPHLGILKTHMNG